MTSPEDAPSPPCGRSAVPPPEVAATVSIPLHQHARYIGDLLASLFAQWRPAFELLLIDDASTDGGLEVAQAALARHPEVRATVMRTEAAEGMGLVARILRLSRGRVVIRADSDDLALPGRLDAVMACFAADPDCRLVTSNALLISPESHAFGIHDTRSASAVLRDPSEAAAAVGDTRWLGATVAYHRDVHERFPPLDPELCPDGLDLLLPFRAVLLGSHHYLAEPLVGWRQHGANTHRASGPYGGPDGAREKYRAVNMMVLAQKVRDAAFLSARSPAPRLDEALRRCRERFDAEFDAWCRLRSRIAARPDGRADPAQGRASLPALPPVPTLAEGETLRFSEGEFGGRILPHHAGFHRAEPWGTWTERVAHLSLRIVAAPARALRLDLRLVAPHLVERQRVSIRVGEGPWLEVEVESAQPRDVELRCPAAETRLFDLVILVRDAIVPAEVDAAWPDPRLIGVGLISVTAVPDPGPPASDARVGGLAAEVGGGPAGA